MSNKGQYLDVETELAYNRSRHYSPESGTYISQDKIRLNSNYVNFYAYVTDNNTLVDVLELSPIIVIGEGQASVDATNKALRDAGYDAESMMVPKNQ